MAADFKEVPGSEPGRVKLYALSTCVWCMKTKKLLDSLGVGYRYLDVDLLSSADQAKAKDSVRKWNPRCSFPTVVVDGERCIVGFDEEKLRKALGK
jgi:glutaredoxin-like protein NrdH